MLYRKFNPCRELEPLVECYYVWQTHDHDLRNIFESPPNGFCSIVFNSGAPYYLGNSKYQRLRVPDQFIAGQAIYYYKLYVPDPIAIAGIVFKPAALNTLYNQGKSFDSDHIFIFKINEENLISRINISWNHADFSRQLGQNAVTEPD